MKKYKWFEIGDINGFFGMIADSMAILAFVAGILIYGFKFPADVVYMYMIPGTTVGIFFGDMIYTWMAFRLAKKTGKDVTAKYVDPRPGDIKHSLADIEAAKSDLGYDPDIDFKAGLDETFKWFTRVFSNSTPVGGIKIGD